MLVPFAVRLAVAGLSRGGDVLVGGDVSLGGTHLGGSLSHTARRRLPSRRCPEPICGAGRVTPTAFPRARAGNTGSMQRGSDKHGPRTDEALQKELAGQLGQAGGHREEWADPEPPADDDPPISSRPEKSDAEPGRS